MRYSAGDLAILNVESYEDGRKHHLAPGKTKMTVAHVENGETHDRSTRKRRKTVSPDVASKEDETRRGRGRPRLEPKHETAQDRRRTQIRLAQRAYRDRKENTIQTLQRRVQELKDANEEMNSAFQKLHDYAVRCGLLKRMPEVADKLQETAKELLALARRSTDEAVNDNDRSRSREPDTQSAKRSSPSWKPSSPDTVQGTAPVPETQLYGGLIVTQEQVPLAELTSAEISSGPTSVTTTTPDYGFMPYSNLDNPSFSFGSPSDFSFSTPELTSSTTPTNFPDVTSINLALYRDLPLPKSFATQEVTFGRRFQRIVLESAWRLVSMPNPPQKRFARAFGFCLLFEPLESIRARVRRGLERTTAESLHNWDYPFLQLGGSTTHFDTTTTSSSQRFGNQGATDVQRTKVANGLSMGPFDAKTTAARDLLEGGPTTQYLPHSGGGAEFYDCDEVEMYLHQRGVAIPPAADFVTAEIEVAAFAADGGGGGGNHHHPSRRHRHHQEEVSHGGASSASAVVVARDAGSGPDDAFVPRTSSERPGSDARGKTQVTLDINRLVNEMVQRATCLGRSPGLRKEDINTAFWSAASITPAVA